MNHSVKIIFGKEEISKFLDGKPLTFEEEEINKKIYNFKTLEEKLAFCKGVNEAVGWTESYIIEDNNS